MTENLSILAELHTVREQLLADSGGSLANLVARLRAEQEASGRTLRKPQRSLRSSGTSVSTEQQRKTAS